MRRHLFAIVSWVLLSSTLSQAANLIEVQGHRGARSRFPENTIPAFQHALEAGVDVLEMDLGVTKDGKLVVNHNTTIDSSICVKADGRPVPGGVLVRSLTLQEIKAFDCGRIRNPRFPQQQPVPGTPIPTLDEVFDLVERSPLPAADQVRFNIEMKSDPNHPEQTVAPEIFARLLLENLSRRRMLNRTIVQSFDYRTLTAIRRLHPSTQISALSENRRENLLTTARRLRANIISPEWDMINEDIVRQLHAMGVKVIPWTANTPQAWQTLLRLKVDGIITDDPQALVQWLQNAAPAPTMR